MNWSGPNASAAVEIFIAAVGVMCTAASMLPELQLITDSVCATSAVLRWTVDFGDGQLQGLHNCSVYSLSQDGGRKLYKSYPLLVRNESFRLENLKSQRQYTLQIRCTEVQSNSVTFIPEACHTQKPWHNVTDEESTVLVYKENTFSVGTRDFVLGILFGLLGFMIITITCFYMWRKFKRRRRLERIRSYLGASLIDPFDNLQGQVDENSSRRLMGSNESLS